jgi:hypothetical protein
VAIEKIEDHVFIYAPVIFESFWRPVDVSFGSHKNVDLCPRSQTKRAHLSATDLGFSLTGAQLQHDAGSMGAVGARWWPWSFL